MATGNRATVLFPNAEVGSIFRFGRVAALHSVLVAALFAGPVSAATLPVVHVWEKQELTFTSTRSRTNQYAEVTVWVDLIGPGFRKRVYGFWDGERTFRVRLLAPTRRCVDMAERFESSRPRSGRQAWRVSRGCLERERQSKESAPKGFSPGHCQPSRHRAG